jgi:hypothetical protein
VVNSGEVLPQSAPRAQRRGGETGEFFANCLAGGTLDSELSHTLSEAQPCYSDEPTQDDNLIAPQITKIPMARAINQISKFIAP